VTAAIRRSISLTAVRLEPPRRLKDDFPWQADSGNHVAAPAKRLSIANEDVRFS
jgi:hypothetical protein